MQYKKPKKPGDLMRQAKKHKKSLTTRGNLTTLSPKVGPRFNSSLGLDSDQWKGGKNMGSFSEPSIFRKKHSGKKHKKSKNWIQNAIKKPGALHRQLGIKPGKKIPAKTLARAASKGGKLGARARLAETLKGLHKKSKHSKTHKKGAMCKGC